MPFIALDPASPQPLYEQIYGAIRDHIVHRRLAPGSKLASSRELVRHLGVSRFTVVAAIDALLAEGYITTRGRSGTYVADTLPDLRLRVAAGRTTKAVVRSRTLSDRGGLERLSNRGRAYAEIQITGPRLLADGPRPFHPRRAPLDVFPVALWSRLVRRHWKRARSQMLDYGEPAGLRGLREAIAEHAEATRGLECTADQVIITSGAQQAFHLIFNLLLDPGDAAWIEEPGYLDARGALAAAGAVAVPVDVDGQGIVVADGIAAAPDARLAYVSPSHQYPTGAMLSASRRIELLQWAHRAGAWIVEDDYDSYFRYRGRPLPALQRLELDWLHNASGRGATPRVLYVGTFSKTMFPSLRLGFCVVPLELASAFTNARAIADRNSSIADQAALEAFMREGHYDRHLRRVRAACEERYEALVAAADRHLRGLISIGEQNAGSHVLGWLAPGLPSAQSIERAAAAEGLVVFPLSRYCIARPARDALVLGYGSSTPRALEAAVRKLKQLLT
jgi:GntR family transcriptional regulator/MocR family aminotransferase